MHAALLTIACDTPDESQRQDLHNGGLLTGQLMVKLRTCGGWCAGPGGAP